MSTRGIRDPVARVRQARRCARRKNGDPCKAYATADGPRECASGAEPRLALGIWTT